MVITTAMLVEQLRVIEAEKAQAMSNLATLDGAERIVKHLLGKIQEAEPAHAMNGEMNGTPANAAADE